MQINLINFFRNFKRKTKIVENRGNYMHLYTGGKYYPLSPRIEDVDIRDIAHSLAGKFRYGGHTREYESVAEHSVYVCDYNVPGCNSPRERLARLLHDGSETYNGDLIRPLKYSSEFREPFKKVEERNERVISLRFGLPFPFERHVKIADEAVTSAEVEQIVNQNKSENWDKKLHDHSVVAPIVIKCLSPKKAKKLFLKRYKQLCKEIYLTEGVVIDGKRPKLKY
jgi:hypothetical protein